MPYPFGQRRPEIIDALGQFCPHRSGILIEHTGEPVAAADGLRQPQEREVLDLILPRNRQPHSGGLVLTSEERDDGAF